MRKHTGQFYKCSKCEFQSVNKGHVLEHEATHSNVKQTCQICKKDYSTIKSLTNHIRKYHGNTTAGQKYLQLYQGKHSKGVVVLHQCHICNRKFKRKIECDKHLYSHNVKISQSVHECELCGHTSIRKASMDTHYQKHRLVYICCMCYIKVPSSLALQKHLVVKHGVDVQDGELGELFRQSVAYSLYLPEPDWPENQLPQVST